MGRSVGKKNRNQRKRRSEETEDEKLINYDLITLMQVGENKGPKKQANIAA